MHEPHVTRRRLLAAAGAGAAVAASGCLGENGTDVAEASDESDDVTFPPHAGETPEPVPEGRSCDGVCGMESAAFPEWNAQLAHADGTGAFFCSPGGLLAYLNAPEHTGANEADVERVWVRDFETKELIDAEPAYFALEEDEDEQQRGEPMGVNPRPFADEDAARAYVADRAWLSVDAVVPFSGLDYSVAHQYNTGRIPQP